ncbi:MAG TPA: hypothetical protein VG245_08670 [Candidatus Dormibacteraeota bacterium]|nr:hypothetical protein [Candidatus Dormibacteraeota bacterium]
MAVAEGDGAAAPAAPRRLALKARDHSVDDRGALELGEYAEHLHHHAAGGRRGIERLGGGAEGDAGLVELIEDVSEATDRTGESVHSVDEEEVEPVQLGLSESTLQLRSLNGAAAHLVGELADELPPVLALDEVPKALVLSLQREGLVVLVGRDAGIGRDPHGGPPLRLILHLQLYHKVVVVLPP